MHVATDFRTIQKIFLGIGTVGLCSSLVMTWKFGHSISVVHGFGLAAVTLAAAFVFPARKFINELGIKSRWLTVAGVFCIGLEFVGDLGYTFGMRDKQVVEAGAQNVAYSLVQKSVASETANLDMWRSQLADLKKRNADQASKNKGWLVTVDPIAMQSQLDAMDQKIANEAKRVRCAQKCEDLKTQRGQLAAMISSAKEENDLTSRIDATQRIIDEKTKTALGTNVGHSTTKAQSNAFARIGLLMTGNAATDSLNPDEISLTLADMFLGLLMAIGATALPTLCFYIAFFGHDAKTFAKPTATTDANGNTIIHHTERIIDNEALRKWAQSAQVRGLIAV